MLILFSTKLQLILHSSEIRFNLTEISLFIKIKSNFSFDFRHRYYIRENIIATIKMRNNFCYPLEMVIFPILREQSKKKQRTDIKKDANRTKKSPILLSQY